MGAIDRGLRERALEIIPRGMWGHLHVDNLTAGYPQFFARAQGAMVWDVDGNEYVDLMCSWGPMVLGHRHPEVEAAAMAQATAGDCLNGPAAVMVDLAEHIVATVPHADWVQFQKNGTDATTSCVTMARAATGKRKILVARGAYHGAVPWCSPSVAGVTMEDRAHVIVYDYNDLASLADAVSQAGDDLAAILVGAFRYELGRDQELASHQFAQAARAACDRTGAALILDDVRAGLRLDLGGSWEPLGIRPDLAAWSKAIANGHALAAVTGTDRFRHGAEKVFVTGSFWCSAVPMAAALATFRIVERDDAVGHMIAMGTLLRDGLDRLGSEAGVRLRQSGPVQMPMILFEDDPDFEKAKLFCSIALKNGAYLHPRHNMFLSSAHSAEDIGRVLEAARPALRAVADLL